MKILFTTVRNAMCRVWQMGRIVYIYKTLLFLLGVGFSFASVYFPAAIVDGVYPVFNTNRLIVMVGAWLVIQFINRVVPYVLNNRISVISANILTQLKVRYGISLSHMRLEKLEDARTLDEIDFMKKGISRGCELEVVNDFFSFLQSVFSICLLLSILSRLSILFFLFAIVVAVVQAFSNSTKEKKMYEHNENTNHLNRELNYTIWWLTGVESGREVRLFGLKDYVNARFHKDRKRLYQSWAGLGRAVAKYTIIPNFLLGLTYGLAYGSMAYLLFLGKITAGEFVLFAGGVLSFSGYISSIANSFVDLKTQSRYLERYHGILEANWSKEEGRGIDLSGMRIEFRHAWFRYPNQNEYALEDVNVVISEHDKIAIVGRNGSGKSTFVKLLMGFYRPTRGEILLNGVNLEEIDKKQLRQIFAPVFQDFYMTAYSVKENITFDSVVNADKEQAVFDALEQAGVLQAVERMPGGLDCAISRKLDDNGVQLSGGETQKLAIARAIYKNAPILILDEPTAALSPNAEYELYERFYEMSQDKTTLFISHRLASCRLCDEILVFEQSRIVESGTHVQLMEKGGLYFDLFTTQAGYYE